MSRWFNFRIKHEILFWFFLLSLVPLVFLTTINYVYQKNVYQEQATDHLELILNQKLKNIDDYIELLTQEVLILSKMSDIKNGMKEFDKEFKNNNNTFNKVKTYNDYFFKNIISNEKFFDIFFINIDGDIVYSIKKESDLGTSLANGVYSKSNLGKVYRDSRDLLEIQISDFEFYAPSNEDAAFMAVPVYDDGDIIGSIAVQINTKKIHNIFTSQEGLGESGEFFGAKLDNDNKTISTTPLLKRKDSIKTQYQFPTRKDLPINIAVNGEKGSGLAYDYKDEAIIAAWGYIPTLRWGIVAKIDLDEILKPIMQLRFYSFIVLFFVSLGIIVAIIIAIKHIVRPIENLTQRVKNFSIEKFDPSSEIELENEIGELARNFNEMSYSLKESQNTIQNYANNLEKKVAVRTKELEIAKTKIEDSNKHMQDYIKIIDTYVITSTTNLAGIITSVSDAFCKITGYTKSELVGKKHNIIRHPDMPDELYDELWNTITAGNIWIGEVKNQRKDGTYYWVKSTITPTYDENNSIKEYTSIREDISDKKIIEKLSITDQLTKLYNRVKLENVFIEEIQRAVRYGKKFSIILIDIDYFKMVNDTHGHDVGDETLKDVAKILEQSVRDTDIVGRWGGEEFLIVAPETDLQNTMNLAEKIRKNIEAFDFKVIGKKTSSFGVASFHPDDTQESMVKRADEALYEAKKDGRNCVKSIELL